ncbi:MAG: ABC transporter permease [Clostridiales bacterium]|nr:ABC transporter permease [Clostridiales bacterium]
MLFKISAKNFHKSFRDYLIYFLTLIVGVSIFYMFNSLDSQQAMLVVSSSTRSIIKLMIRLIDLVSVFVAIILGFLIVYAGNFLIRRRKKEFGLYMAMGMSKRQISQILLGETFLIGLISLGVGLVVGIFGSQLMSILVARLFQADMSRYKFVFSKAACLKTCLYFGIMYLAVMLLNVFMISKYKLVDLLSASKKNEKVRMKNPVVCVIVFVISVITLGIAYYLVTDGIRKLTSEASIAIPIVMGIIATFLIFWSVSGIALRFFQQKKSIYLKDSNIFVLRQIHNRINTTVTSMTIISLLLFMTISVLSTALSLNRLITQDIEKMTPVDLNLWKRANISPEGEAIEAQIQDSKVPVSTTLRENGLDMSVLTDITEFYTYQVAGWNWEKSLDCIIDETKELYPALQYQSPEELVKISDYNRLAKLYGIDTYELSDNEYIVLCNFDSMAALRNQALAIDSDVEIDGKTYHSRYDTCKDGYMEISTGSTNTGLILVPDDFPLTEDMRYRCFLAANYSGQSKEEKRDIEQLFIEGGEGDRIFYDNVFKNGIEMDGMTKISVIESSLGISTIISFVAIYLGVIFLIACSAILALKELSENSDNRDRYLILRKLGMDEKMINRTLFRQIGIFFIVPLILAIIHSVFGIRFALILAAVQVNTREMLPSVIATAAFLVLVYGGYFLATYVGSKNIIRDSLTR